jgi:hypothetical protein
MKYQKMRKDITRLIDDIKYHSDALTPMDRLPIIQLNIILAKMNQMMEKTIILKHYIETEMEQSREYYSATETTTQTEEETVQTEVEPAPTAAAEIPEKKEAVVPEGLSDNPPDLKLAIGIYERYLFANELFNGSIEAYEEAIKALNDFNTIEKAVQYIDEGLKKEYNWDMESNVTEQFVTLVKRRYGKN